MLISAGFRALIEGPFDSLPSIRSWECSIAPTWQLWQLCSRPACLLCMNEFENAGSWHVLQSLASSVLTSAALASSRPLAGPSSSRPARARPAPRRREDDEGSKRCAHEGPPFTRTSWTAARAGPPTRGLRRIHAAADRQSARHVPGPVEALPELLHELALEPVVPAQGDLAGQPALACPTRDRVGGDAEELRDLRTGQE